MHDLLARRTGDEINESGYWEAVLGEVSTDVGEVVEFVREATEAKGEFV